jgi:hypothetical protein
MLEERLCPEKWKYAGYERDFGGKKPDVAQPCWRALKCPAPYCYCNYLVTQNKCPALFTIRRIVMRAQATALHVEMILLIPTKRSDRGLLQQSLHSNLEVHNRSQVIKGMHASVLSI